MFKYVGNNEVSNDIPGEISKFLTEDLNNYLVIKDGFIIAKKLDESLEIQDEKELLKMKLTVFLLRTISKMETSDVLSITGLHKSDLSRLQQ